ncbi:MAG: Na+/H+ antiporter NhaC family protein [Hyphomicrobiales bacterium]
MNQLGDLNNVEDYNYSIEGIKVLNNEGKKAFHKSIYHLIFRSKTNTVKKTFTFCLFTLLILLSGNVKSQNIPLLDQEDIEVSWPSIIMRDINSTIELKLKTPKAIQTFDNKEVTAFINQKPYGIRFEDEKATIDYDFPQDETVIVQVDNFTAKKDVTPIPLWTSILPPLIAILMALVFKEVYSALFTGLLVGTTTIFYYGGSNLFFSIIRGIFEIVDTYIIQALLEKDHLSIIVFSLFIGATVHLITRNGGMKGVVNILSKRANSPKSGQFITWILGVIIFFDDYANTLVVGNTMRPVTDRLKISREKLAYIVDSTAAPVAAIAFITTWIGAELSYISSGIKSIGIDVKPYNVFMSSLEYAYYPIFTLIFILFIIFLGSDYGPMRKSELRARNTGQVSPAAAEDTQSSEELTPKKGIKPRAFNAVIPVLVIILGTFAGLFYTGWNQEIWDSPTLAFTQKLSAIIGNANSFTALLWSSFMGMASALILTMVQKIMKLQETIDNLMEGIKSMLAAILILTLAWSIAQVTQNMHTADFISRSLLEVNLSPYILPALSFILAAVVSFSTGSSWGTMAILYPLIIPASWYVAMDFGMTQDEALPIFFNVVSTVLAGSVLGDHCSPISDTTILSSLASNCTHIEHVRTQLPYALTVGAVSVVFGTLPAAYGIPSYILFPLGIIILFLIVKVFGKKIPNKAKV